MLHVVALLLKVTKAPIYKKYIIMVALAFLLLSDTHHSFFLPGVNTIKRASNPVIFHASIC